MLLLSVHVTRVSRFQNQDGNAFRSSLCEFACMCAERRVASQNVNFWLYVHVSYRILQPSLSLLASSLLPTMHSKEHRVRRSRVYYRPSSQVWVELSFRIVITSSCRCCCRCCCELTLTSLGCRAPDAAPNKTAVVAVKNTTSLPPKRIDEDLIVVRMATVFELFTPRRVRAWCV